MWVIRVSGYLSEIVMVHDFTVPINCLALFAEKLARSEIAHDFMSKPERGINYVNPALQTTLFV